MTRRLSFLLAFSLLLLQSAAAQGIKLTPAVETSGDYRYTTVPDDPLNARYYTLPNGLTVILSVNRSEPRVQTLIAVKAGSKNDPADNTGLAHYLEHMLFKGTDLFGTSNWEAEKRELSVIEDLYDRYNRTTDPAERMRIYHRIDSVSGVAARYAIANEYDKLVGSLGATGTNAFTSNEQTVYMNDIPSNQIDKWLKIEGERFRAPVFRLFHTELEAVYEEKNISLDSDGEKAYDIMMADLFPHHTYGTQTTIGTVEHLKNPSLRKIREYYNTYYVPNNMAVIIVGDLDPDMTIRMVDRYFGPLPSGTVPPYLFTQEPERKEPREYSVYGPEAENLLMAWRFPGAGTREAMMLELTDLLLAYKGAGLLDLNLNKKQRVQQAGCSPSVNKDYSWHTFFGSPKEGQSLEEVRDLILAEIEKIKRGEFSDADIRAVVRNLKVDQMKQYQNNAGRAFALLSTFVTGTNPNIEARKFELMEKVTREQLMEFAAKSYNNDYVVVFKRQGEQEETEKVEKPAITPVVLNRTEASPFARSIYDAQAAPVTPLFTDYAGDIGRRSMPNGMEILSVPNTENDLFSLYYVLEMGSDNDRKLPFAVNYLEYLGTDKYTAEQLSKKFFELGCSFNVSAGRNRVFVSLQGPDESLEQGVALFEEFLANAKPDADALQGMIDLELKSRADAKLDKSAILWQGLYNYAMYGPDNPFTYRLSEQELRGLKPAELTDRIHSLTGYKHSALYYGPRSAEEIRGVLQKLHQAPATLKDYPPAKVFARRDTKENTVYFTDYDMVQAEVIWLNRSAQFDPKATPVVDMFNQYYGGGMGSVVFQEIRESKALAYGSFSAYDSPDKAGDPYYILSYIGTQSDKLDQAITAMNELHTTMPQSNELFAIAKEALRNQIETERTTRADILFDYLGARDLGLDYDIRKPVYESLGSMALADLNAFHSERYSGKPFAYCVIGSKENLDMQALAKRGKIVNVSLTELFGY